nr:lysozyme [Pelagibacteraceae bacterium]
MTIGYGHTGLDVYIGQVITEPEAEAILRADLNEFEEAVNNLITVYLTQHEFDACVSFAFNVGKGALKDSTFRRRINSGENKSTCFEEEFPRWVNGPNGPLQGLINRRNAEIALACS